MKIGKTFKKLLGNKGKGGKVGEDPPPGGTELEDLLDEIGDLDATGDAPDEGDEAGMDAGGMNERLEMRFSETDGKLDKVEQGLNSTQKQSEKIRGDITELQDNIRKLLSIYEIVYKDINPFIEDEEDVLDIPPPLEDAEFPAPLEFGEDGGDGDDSAVFGMPGMPGSPDAAVPITVEIVLEEGMTDQAVGTVKELLDEGNFEEALELLKAGVDSKEGISATVSSQAGDGPHTRTQDLLDEAREGPILKEIPVDYLSNVTLMRWMEFLLEKMPRKKVPLVLEYYVSNRWISKEVKYRIVGFLRGELGGMMPPPLHEDVGIPVHGPPRPPFSHMPELKPMEDGFDSWKESPPPPYRSNGKGGTNGRNGRTPHSGWRLSAEDHLKSLLFINMIAGREIDRDRLTCREYDIGIIKHALEEYHGI